MLSNLEHGLPFLEDDTVEFSIQRISSSVRRFLVPAVFGLIELSDSALSFHLNQKVVNLSNSDVI